MLCEPPWVNTRVSFGMHLPCAINVTWSSNLRSLTAQVNASPIQWGWKCIEGTLALNCTVTEASVRSSTCRFFLTMHTVGSQHNALQFERRFAHRAWQFASTDRVRRSKALSALPHRACPKPRNHQGHCIGCRTSQASPPQRDSFADVSPKYSPRVCPSALGLSC